MTRTIPDRVLAIATRLARPIPEAPRPVPKPVKAWQGLVVDHLLTTRQDWAPNPQIGVVPWGATVKVTATTNEGATLQLVGRPADMEPDEAARSFDWIGKSFLLDDRGWRVYLKRVPKPRTPNPKRKVVK